MTEIALLMLIQNANLMYVDIFLYTRPGMAQGYREGNPIADMYWQAGQWELGYLSALLINGIIAMTGEGLGSQLLLAGIGAAEVWAVSTWDQVHIRPINVQCQLLIIRF
jgi:hypothetical protein